MVLWQECGDFGAERLEERFVVPYFFRDGCGGLKATGIRAKLAACGGC